MAEHILVVDDDASQLKLIGRNLRNAGYEVTPSLSVDEALRLAQEAPPDAILSDVLMPGRDGFALCTLARGEPSLSSIPIVLMSHHYVEPQDHELATRSGANAYVSRASNFDEVLQVLREILKEKNVVALRPSDHDAFRDAHLERVTRQLDRQLLELSRVRAKLAVSQTWARSLMENANVAVSLLTASGVILDVNAYWEQLCGVPRGLVMGRHIAQHLPPSEAAARTEQFLSTMEHGRGHFENVVILRPDGSTRYVDFSTSVIELEGEKLVFSIGRDVTSRRLGELELKERAELAMLVSEVNVALASADALDGCLDRCARAVVSHLGAAFARIWTLNEHDNTLELVASAGMYTHLDGGHARVPVGAYKIGRIAQNRQPHFTNSVHTDPAVSDPAWAMREGMVAFAGHPLIVEGQVTGVLAMFSKHALSDAVQSSLAAIADALAVGIRRKSIEQERTNLQTQLLHAQKMEAIGQFSGGIAHDFNNLLAVILSCSDFLMQDLAEQDPRRQDAADIYQAGKRAAALTRQLLAFSRQLVVEPREVELNEIVGDLQKMLRRLIGEDIELDIRQGPDLSRVLIDPGQMDQVIMNLVVNARDAMPRGGKLTIQTQDVEIGPEFFSEPEGGRHGAHVLLSVSDTGSGMDPETLQRIFEPFFTTKALGRGTGLGLSTVYGIVKQAGGEIRVDSSPGAGSTFRIYFPRLTANVARADPASLSPTSERPADATVLVVEDEQVVRSLATRILRSRGYRVLEASGGEEALSLFEQHAELIDLLLTDMVMPQQNGADLAMALRQRAPRMKVVFMSGHTDHPIVREGGLAPGFGFLQKPFTPDQLAAKVRQVLAS